MKWEPVIRQLENGGLVRRTDGCVKIPDHYPEISLLNAIDVMLLLSPKEKSKLFTEKDCRPFLLRFLKKGIKTLWRYDICSVPLGGEPMISAALEGISTKYRMMVFYLLRKPEQQKVYSYLVNIVLRGKITANIAFTND